jgi:hypothetical protein
MRNGRSGLILVGLFAGSLGAQQLDSTRAGVTLPAPSAGVADVRDLRTAPEEARPPISPRRAFLYSFLLPGSAQARLDRANTGGMFILIEATALALLHRSAEDLRIARSFSRDSMPLRYQVDPVTGLVARDSDGVPVVAEWGRSRYDADWVRTRKLHYEDWLAVLFFNHLFAGADAFVAAQLWDLDARVSARRSAQGTAVGATIRFR